MEIIQLVIKKNGNFPNNPQLPVLHYQEVFKLSDVMDDNNKIITGIFLHHNWTNTWVNGIYNYHHYHSNTHEVLGILNGYCSVILGGERGVVYQVSKGDVLIIPAGVAHKNEESSEDFCCIGAYPNGHEYNMRYGKPEELSEAEAAIRQVTLPETDPIYGDEGPLFDYWNIQLGKTTNITRKTP